MNSSTFILPTASLIVRLSRGTLHHFAFESKAEHMIPSSWRKDTVKDLRVELARRNESALRAETAPSSSLGRRHVVTLARSEFAVHSDGCTAYLHL
jgi:hypothetical protein